MLKPPFFPRYPYDKSGANASGFTFEKDLATAPAAKAKRELPMPLTPKLAPSRRLYATSPDAKLIFTGGHWDNSLQVNKSIHLCCCQRNTAKWHSNHLVGKTN